MTKKNKICGNFLIRLRQSKELLWHDGFAMIEVVLAISICGIITQFILSGLVSMKHFQNDKRTEEHAQVVFRSLAAYVVRNGCLPYASKPTRAGTEYDHPTNEDDWHSNSAELMRGTIPYKTLGLPEKYAKDGHGSYFTYIMNPALGARQDVISVPVGDIREYFDYREGATLEKIASVNDGTIVMVQDKAGPSRSGPGDIPIGAIRRTIDKNRYSSYRAVRSFDKEYECPQSPLIDGDLLTKVWDIVTRIPEAQIKCFHRDVIVECDQSYYLFPPKFIGDSAGIVNCGYLDGNIFKDQADNSLEKYKVQNCVAIVLISHGKSRVGAYRNDDQVIRGKNTEATAGSYRNSNDNPVKNECHLDAPGNLVYWQSRFGLLDLLTQHICAPAQIVCG